LEVYVYIQTKDGFGAVVLAFGCNLIQLFQPFWEERTCLRPCFLRQMLLLQSECAWADGAQVISEPEPIPPKTRCASVESDLVALSWTPGNFVKLNCARVFVLVVGVVSGLVAFKA